MSEKIELSDLVKQIRSEFGASDAKRDAELSTPADIERFDNIVYGPDSLWNVLDVYRPVKSGGRVLPVILNVHGGGWVYGTKETYQFYAMALAQHGFAVVNYTYRLAPESRFPASVEDTDSVVRWIISNADIYGFDLDNFFATGDSAGAHLLSVYTAALSNPDYSKKLNCGILDDFNFKAVALNCGKYSFKDPIFGDMKLLDELIGPGENNPLRPLVESVDFVTENFPETYLMTCDGDFLKAHAPLLASKFTEKNVPFEFRFYSENNGGLWHCFQNSIQHETGKKQRDDECSFFLRMMQK